MNARALLLVLSIVANVSGAGPSFAQAGSPRSTSGAAASVTSPAAQAGASVPRVAPSLRAGTLVRPESVTVGDPFVFVVSVEVPANARVAWPSIVDTMAVVVMRDPVRVTSREKGPSRVETATYALAAWDVGALPIGLPDATVRVSGQVLRVPMGDARVVVRTVLPGDTTLHTPKPAKALFPRVVPWWERWWPALAVVTALGLLWWLWRRRKHAVAGRSRATLDVFARAIHDFERLERLALVDAGESGRFVALAIEILRTYLSARIPDATLSRTTPELVVVMADDIRVPIAHLLTLLDEADGIKFARRPVTPERAHVLAGDARAIVEQIERAEQARVAAEAAARSAREQQERENAQKIEDDARRKSRVKSGAA